MRAFRYTMTGLYGGMALVAVRCAWICRTNDAPVGAGLFALLGCVTVMIAGMFYAHR